MTTLRVSGYDLQVNSRGVIDATGIFNTATYMAGGPNAWALSGPSDVLALLLHHWAGWFGARLTERSTPSEELEQIKAAARYHRGRWGIGPGYNMIGAPSGRLWAVGKHGTHRAHTKGRIPGTRGRDGLPIPYNVGGRALAMMGNYEIEPVTDLIADAIRRGLAELRSWPGVRAGAPLHEHGLAPTVNRSGVRFSQATLCPGRNIMAWRAAGGLKVGGEPDLEPGTYADGWGDAISEATEAVDALA